MRHEPWLVMSPVSRPPHSTDGPSASCHQLSELISRMNQMVERLQHFQRRYRTQLSRTDQEWLHHTQQQIAFDLARLAHLADTDSVTPDATQPPVSPRKAEPIAQLVKQIVRLAQNTTEMVQTAISPLAQHPASGLPHDAHTAHRPLRDPGMTLDDQVEAPRHLRPKSEGSSGKRHRISRSEV